MSKKKKNQTEKNEVKVDKVFNYCDNAYETLSLAEKDKIEKESNVSKPSLDNVVETREWCEENKK